jgi:hypothetical protein
MELATGRILPPIFSFFKLNKNGSRRRLGSTDRPTPYRRSRALQALHAVE